MFNPVAYTVRSWKLTPVLFPTTLTPNQFEYVSGIVEQATGLEARTANASKDGARFGGWSDVISNPKDDPRITARSRKAIAKTFTFFIRF